MLWGGLRCAEVRGVMGQAEVCRGERCYGAG